MTTYFSESFETCDLAGWTLGTAAAGTITCSNIQAYGGTWSCRIYGPTIASQAYGYKAMIEALGDHHLQYYIWVDASVQPDNCLITQLYDVSLVAVNMYTGLDYHDAKYYLREYHGGAWYDIAEIPTGEWVKVDAYFNDTTDKVIYYVNDVFQVETDAETGAADPDRIYIGDTSTVAYKGFYYLDDILVDDASPPVVKKAKPASIIPLMKVLDFLQTKPFSKRFPKFKPRLVA